MKIFWNYILNRDPLVFLFLASIFLLLSSVGKLSYSGSEIVALDTAGRMATGAIGGILLVVALILFWNEMPWSPHGSASATSSHSDLDKEFLRRLPLSGLNEAFRIKVENSLRLERVKELIAEEAKGPCSLKLLASSGHHYINKMGNVWNDAHLGELLEAGRMNLIVVLESPFADFAQTRAAANNTLNDHWVERQPPEGLIELLRHPNIQIRVTSIPVNCSLFITSKNVLYDPYLWGRPHPGEATENNFWVFEFCPADDKHRDCYNLLNRHFDFCFEHSKRLEDFLYIPQAGESQRYGLDFYVAFQAAPDKYLAGFHQRTRLFAKEVMAFKRNHT
jgi:hypothetical protein